MTNDQLNIAELQKLAEAVMQPIGNMVDPREASIRYMTTRQQFHTAANPQAVLSLVERIKELEKQNAELRKDAERYRWLRQDVNGREDVAAKLVRENCEEFLDAAIDAALASVQGEQKEYAWECNECGSQEYTMSVSEDDVNRLGCGRCGGDEWHKAEVRK